MTFEDAKKNLLVHYSKYGITEKIIVDAMNDGINNYGLSVNAVYNGLRMALSTTAAKEEHEYFTVEDVMSITGETREEVIQRIEEMRKEIENQGGNPDDYAVTRKKENCTLFFFPNGLDTKEKE